MSKRYYNPTNSCDRCRIKFELVYGHPYREYNKEGNWTGKMICAKCYQEEPYSSHGKMKLIANIRTGNLDPTCTTYKGQMFEAITCKTRGVKNLNIENDNFRSLIDHSRDSELGIIQSKGTIYIPRYRHWARNWSNEHYKDFDNLIFYCMDQYMINIERIYVFPWHEVLKRTGITIYKNDNNHWYDEYRVDEKPYNDAYHNLNGEDLKFRKKIKK